MNLRRPQMGLWVLACASLWMGAGCQPAEEEGDALSPASAVEAAGVPEGDATGRLSTTS
jgi:hypothetical protein